MIRNQIIRHQFGVLLATVCTITICDISTAQTRWDNHRDLPQLEDDPIEIDDGMSVCCHSPLQPEDGCTKVATEDDCDDLGGTFVEGSDDCTWCARGACCLGDNTCLDTSRINCDLAGGGFLPDATCAEVDCRDPHACCDEGDCSLAAPFECAAAGGTPHNDSSCATADCSTTLPRGACCEGGGCTDNLTEEDCQGIFLGEGSACDDCDQPVDCCVDGECSSKSANDCQDDGGSVVPDCDACEPTGACCDDGECTQTTPTMCTGTFADGPCQSDVCGPATKPPPIEEPDDPIDLDPISLPLPVQGACCQPNQQTCNWTAEENCEGTFSAGVSCDEVDCDLGACCHGDASCTDEPYGLCVGTYMGDGTSCADGIDCGLGSGETGACCRPNEQDCIEATELECIVYAGVYQGDNTLCDDQDVCKMGACCVPAAPQPQTWEGCCVYTTESECADYWLGEFTLNQECTYEEEGQHKNHCLENDHPEWAGACCTAGLCKDGLTECECEDGGGGHYGHGTTCEQEVCPGLSQMTQLLIDSNNDCVINSSDEHVEEDAPGKLILLNSDDDDGNGVADFDELGKIDNDTSQLLNIGDHCNYILDEDVAWWQLSYPEHSVRVFVSEDRAPSSVVPSDVPMSFSERFPLGQTLYVEGLQLTSPGEVEITLQMYSDGCDTVISDRVVATVVRFEDQVSDPDIRVDSDNSCGVPDGNDEMIEDDGLRSGVIVYVNEDDDDNNGIADLDDSLGNHFDNDLRVLQFEKWDTACARSSPDQSHWQVTYPDDDIVVHLAADRSSPIASGEAQLFDINDGLPASLYIEGLRQTSAAVAISLDVVVDNRAAMSDVVHATVSDYPGDDYRIDSNNDCDIDSLGNTDERIEDRIDLPGKRLFVDQVGAVGTNYIVRKGDVCLDAAASFQIDFPDNHIVVSTDDLDDCDLSINSGQQYSRRAPDTLCIQGVSVSNQPGDVEVVIESEVDNLAVVDTLRATVECLLDQDYLEPPGDTPHTGTDAFLSTGEVFMIEPDVGAPGPGLPVLFGRTYRSRSCHSGLLGPGWSHNYDIYVRQICADDSAVFLHRGADGRDDRFTDQGDGIYTNDRITDLELTRTEDANLVTYVMTSAGLTKWVFHPLHKSAEAWTSLDGKIDYIVTRNGNTLRFEYDANNRLQYVIDSLGRRALALHYDDARGRLQTVTAFPNTAHSRTVSYAYDTGGQLTARQYIDRTTQYRYTSGFEDARLNHNLAARTDANGNTTRFYYAHTIDSVEGYDRSHFRYTQDREHSYYDRMVMLQQPNGGVFDIVYDDSLNAAIVNDPIGNVTVRKFDALGRTTETHTYTGRWTSDRPTRAEDLGSPTTQKRRHDPDIFEDPTMFITRIAYAGNSMLPARTTANEGDEIEYVYKLHSGVRGRLAGNLLARIHHPGTRGGDQAEHKTTYTYYTTYDGLGTDWIETVTPPKGQGNLDYTTVHEYDDARGDITHTHHPDGGITSRMYDYDNGHIGQLIRLTHPANGPNGTGHRRVDRYAYYPETSGSQGLLQFHVVDEDGAALITEYERDPYDNIVKTTDPYGNEQINGYTPYDELEWTFAYDGLESDGRILAHTLRFYDHNSNLIRHDVLQQYKDGPTDENFFYSTMYEHDAMNSVTRSCAESEDSALDGQLDCNDLGGLGGHFVYQAYEYDRNNQQTKFKNGLSARPGSPGTCHESTPDACNITVTEYDERQLPFRTKRYYVDKDGVHEHVTQYNYDRNGNTLHSDTWDTSHVRQRSAVRTYDGFGRVATVTDPMGNVAATHYDAHGNPGVPPQDADFGIIFRGQLIDVEGSAGNKILSQSRVVYDVMDRPIEEIVAHFDLETSTPIDDGLSKTIRTYSQAGQLLTETNDRGFTTRLTYDTANRQSTGTDPLGNTITIAYLRSESAPHHRLIRQTSTEIPDIVGEPTEQYVQQTEFNGLGQPIAVSHLNPDDINDVLSTSRTDYDTRQHARLVIDAEDNEVRQEYDGLGRTTLTSRSLSASESVITSQQYDDASRVVIQTDGKDDALNINKTVYLYDEMDRLVITRMPDGTLQQNGEGATCPDGINVDASEFCNGHDLFGVARTVTDANGTLITSTPDKLGRVTSRRVYPGKGVQWSSELNTTTEEIQYNSLSLIQHARNRASNTRLVHYDTQLTRTHDSIGNVLSERTAQLRQPPRTVTAKYDGMGNRVKLIYPDEHTIRYVFDALNRIKDVFEDSPTTTHIAHYDYVGPTRVARRSHPDQDTRTDFGYDSLRRITTTVSGRVQDDSNLGDIDSRSYAWDRMNNLTRRTDVRPDTLQLAQSFAYDALYRMTRSTRHVPAGPDIIREQAFDGAGNRGVEADLTYERDARSHQQGGMADAQVNQYTRIPQGVVNYDDNGNMRRVVASSTRGTDHLYDYRNQLVALHSLSGRNLLPKSILAMYRYDPLSRRVEYRPKTKGSGKDGIDHEFIYEGARVIQETRFATRLSTRTGPADRYNYVYGAYIDELLMARTWERNQETGQWDDPEDHYYYADAGYNIVAITDDQANVIEHIDYVNDPHNPADRSGDYGKPTLVLPSRQVPDQGSILRSFLDEDNLPATEVVAEDITPIRDIVLNGIRVWGGHDGPDKTDQFTVQIYDDAAGLPGAILHEFHAPIDIMVVRESTGRVLPGSDGDILEYQYWIQFDTALELAAGTTVWFAVWNDTTFFSPWGWESSRATEGDHVAILRNGQAWQHLATTNVSIDLITEQVSTIDNRYFFGGLRYDEETDLYYVRSRYMDPVTGRFITRDPAGVFADAANLGNGYTFAGNNPWSRLDPSGQTSSLLQEARSGAFWRGAGEGLVDGVAMMFGFDPIFGKYDRSLMIRSQLLTGFGAAGLTFGVGLGAYSGSVAYARFAAAIGGVDLVAGSVMASVGGYRAATGDNSGYMTLGLGILNMMSGIGNFLMVDDAARYAAAAKHVDGDHCFTGDTLVLTPEGLVPIKDIRVGDRVITQSTLQHMPSRLKAKPSPYVAIIIVSLLIGLMTSVAPKKLLSKRQSLLLFVLLTAAAMTYFGYSTTTGHDLNDISTANTKPITASSNHSVLADAHE